MLFINLGHTTCFTQPFCTTRTGNFSVHNVELTLNIGMNPQLVLSNGVTVCSKMLTKTEKSRITLCSSTINKVGRKKYGCLDDADDVGSVLQ